MNDFFLMGASTNDSPVFVCRCCGGILRVLVYDPDSRVQCAFCGTMTVKTKYTLSDDEGMYMYGREKKYREFQEKVRQEYVYGSEQFDKKAFSARVKYIRDRDRGHY